jgi:hypothetical protein
MRPSGMSRSTTCSLVAGTSISSVVDQSERVIQSA